MRMADKERLKMIVDDAAGTYNKTAAYDAIAAAEQEESDPVARQLLHDAALALLHGQLDRTRALLDTIAPAG